MARLFAVSEVEQADGHWSIGYEVASVCGVLVATADPCDPLPAPIGDTDPASTGVYKVVPFGALARINRPMRCLESDRDLVAARLRGASETVAEYALWFGLGLDGSESIADSATTVTAGSGIEESIAAVIAAQNQAIPGVEPGLLHLGLGVALKLRGQAVDTLGEMGYEIVTGPLYPPGGIAVTGPVRVQLGSIEVDDFYSVASNQGSTVGTRVMAVGFDPCASFVIGV